MARTKGLSVLTTRLLTKLVGSHEGTRSRDLLQRLVPSCVPTFAHTCIELFWFSVKYPFPQGFAQNRSLYSCVLIHLAYECK